MGLVPEPAVPSTGGKFYPCFLLEEGTSAAVEHPSKAGEVLGHGVVLRAGAGAPSLLAAPFMRV